MPYKTARPMKIQMVDGTVELRPAGKDVPEADSWPNPGLWVRRGYLIPSDAETVINAGYTRAKLKPMRPATDEDSMRGTGVPIPQQGEELPGYKGQGNVRPADSPLEAAHAKLKVAKERAKTMFAAAEDAGEAVDTAIEELEQAEADAEKQAADDKEAAEHAAASEAKAEADAEAKAEAGADTESDEDIKAELMKLHRPDMDALAKEQGIKDAEDYPNKGILADAIMEATGA